MIRLSTNEINLKSSPEELLSFLSDPQGVAKVLFYKKIKHLEVQNDLITFIHKWVARFNFKISERTPTSLLIESTEGVEFRTAIMFEFNPANEGCSFVIHFETDTAPVIDFTFEKRAKSWIEAMVVNFDKLFN